MGRFSRLETDRNHHAAVDQPGGGPPESAERLPAEYADMDAAGCLRQGDRALFSDQARAALRWYSRSVDLDSTRIDAWSRMILVLLLRRSPGEASAWIERALGVWPDHPRMLALRAAEHARRGMMRQAIAASDAALERGGTDPVVHLARAEVLLLAGKKSADYCFKQALTLAGADDVQMPMFIGLLLRERRRWIKAIDYFEQAAKRGDRRPLAWYQIGLCQAAAGQRALSRKSFETARELCDPDDPLLRQLGRVCTGSMWKRLGRLFGRK